MLLLEIWCWALNSFTKDHLMAMWELSCWWPYHQKILVWWPYHQENVAGRHFKEENTSLSLKVWLHYTFSLPTCTLFVLAEQQAISQERCSRHDSTAEARPPDIFEQIHLCTRQVAWVQTLNLVNTKQGLNYVTKEIPGSSHFVRRNRQDWEGQER